MARDSLSPIALLCLKSEVVGEILRQEDKQGWNLGDGVEGQVEHVGWTAMEGDSRSALLNPSFRVLLSCGEVAVSGPWALWLADEAFLSPTLV